MEMESYVAITVLCYMVAEFLKAVGINSKYIPVICMASGGALGVLGGFLGVIGGTILDTVATGVVSGLASTGANQVYKKAVGE